MTTIALVLLWYGSLATRINGAVSGLLVEHTSLARRYPLMAVTSTFRLAVGGVLQAGFFVVLLLVAGLGPGDFVSDGPQVVLLAYGVLLGVGEMALGSFLCNVAMRAAPVVFSGRVPATAGEWYAASKGGWMRAFLKTLEIVPRPLALAAIVVYVGVEEAVFRGVVISALEPSGVTTAFGVSVILFVAAQTFNMPGFANALFPMIGAFVIGVVHGALYLAVPNILPLIVAHVTVFLSAALTRRAGPSRPLAAAPGWHAG